MGPTSIQINIWAMPGGLSAGPERTVREAGVTVPHATILVKWSMEIELLPAPPCIVVVGQLRGRQRAGPYEKGSREVASGSGLRGGGIPESSADRKDARISEIGGRGRDEEQARLPAAAR